MYMHVCMQATLLVRSWWIKEEPLAIQKLSCGMHEIHIIDKDNIEEKVFWGFLSEGSEVERKYPQ